MRAQRRIAILTILESADNLTLVRLVAQQVVSKFAAEVKTTQEKQK